MRDKIAEIIHTHWTDCISSIFLADKILDLIRESMPKEKETSYPEPCYDYAFGEGYNEYRKEMLKILGEKCLDK